MTSEVAAADERLDDDERFHGREKRADRNAAVAAVRPASLADLYRDRYGPMVRLAYLMVGSTSVAEELVQDAFARMHRHWDNAEHPKAYLRMAVVNACRSHLRRQSMERAYRRHPSAMADGDRAGVPWAEPDELFDALSALPARQRAALVLRFYEDLSEAEIALALGCRPGTVKSLLHRGLAELRSVVEP
ncbi:MAG TPA: SigE family RNA polymerase sigma factor [Acidimicrobiales bacterium]|nr:SigE family RNA polymerase sigma factor [Acidimicrobiales bacterium]